MAGGIRNTGGDSDELVENHEINVTPFIDVMLVLLIIFMVAAPLATVDINVDLPVSNAPVAERPDTPVWLTVKPDLSLALGNDPIPAGALQQALTTATEGDNQRRIFLRADAAVPYGDLMTVMNQMRDAGFLKIALVGLDATSAPPAAAPAPASAPAATPQP
ncbi:MAG: TonB system transport protein ExbD [Paracoccus denitrificans]|nr:MAG: TonB system transport protein ExbD [Paracoccus denitrificans]PZO85501.1 MAG: TonB system transport protein ExbD [Paracoccus denitrificans]